MTSLQAFKKATVIGYCLKQIKDKDGNLLEFYQSKNGLMIIEIHDGQRGFQVYKQAPDAELQSSIDFINNN